MSIMGVSFFMNFKQRRSEINVELKMEPMFCFVFKWNPYCGKWDCTEKKSSQYALQLLDKSTNHQQIQQLSAPGRNNSEE